jgi:hypothetical protein
MKSLEHFCCENRTCYYRVGSYAIRRVGAPLFRAPNHLSAGVSLAIHGRQRAHEAIQPAALGDGAHHFFFFLLKNNNSIYSSEALGIAAILYKLAAMKMM